MKKLLFILSFLYACNPANVEIKDDTHTGEADQPAEVLEPVGIITADDCQQIDIGDKACNFRLADQAGNTWELYDHLGDVIVLDFSTVWCYPCQLAGHHAQPIQDIYQDDGVQFVTVLIDGATSGVEPTTQEITDWVNSHQITSSPVLQGSRDKMLDPAGIGEDGYLLGGFPTYIYIGRDMKFYTAHVGFSEEYVKEKIEEGL
jgi:hypothetical protein